MKRIFKLFSILIIVGMLISCSLLDSLTISIPDITTSNTVSNTTTTTSGTKKPITSGTPNTTTTNPTTSTTIKPTTNSTSTTTTITSKPITTTTTKSTTTTTTKKTTTTTTQSNEVELVFNANGGTFDNETIISLIGERNKTNSFNLIPTKKGHEFVGWKVNDILIDLNTFTFTEDITELYATYKPIEIDKIEYYFEFTLEGDEYSVSTKNVLDMEYLVLPSEYNGKKVTKLSSLYVPGETPGMLSHTNVKYLYIPSSYKYIDCDFYNLNNLLSIEIEEGTNFEYINDWCFQSLYKIVEIHNNSSMNIQIGSSSYGNIALNAKVVYNTPTLSKITCVNGFYLFENNNEVHLISYEGLESMITIPSEVTIIGPYCFYTNTIKESYSGIVKVNFDDDSKLHTIREYSFTGCSNLVSIELPESLKHIEDYAFYCNKLYDIQNKSSLNLIPNSSNYGNVAQFAKNIYKDDGDNKVFFENDFVYYLDNSGKILVKYFGNEKELILDNDIVKIEEFAFQNNKIIEKVIFNEDSKLTEIGGYAFYSCSNLVSINIPKNITSLSSTFSECINLTEVIFAEDSLLSNLDWTFNNCKSLKELYIPDNVSYVNYLFYGCDNLEVISLPRGFSFKSLFGYYSISDANYKINKVIIRGDITQSLDIALPLEELVLLEGITSLSYGSIQNVNNLYLPKSLPNFTSGCISNVINIYYDGTLEDWLNIDFSNNGILNDVSKLYLKNENNEYEYLYEVKIPEGIKTISRYAFYGYKGMLKVELPTTLESIESDTFYNSKMIEIYNKSDLDIYFWYANVYKNQEESKLLVYNGHAYKKENDEYIYIRYLNDDKVVEIPNFITKIDNSAFYKSNVEKVILPDSVTTIGSNAFYYSYNLKSIVFSNNLTSIDYEAFRKCINLTSVELPNSLIYLGSNAFAECENLTFVSLSSKLTQIKEHTFENCINLETIYIPDSVITIGYSAFNQCKNLNKVRLSENLERIESRAFYQCINLTMISFPKSLRYICDSAFYGNTKLEEIYFDKDYNLLTIESNVFYGCEALKNIYLYSPSDTWCYISFNDYESNPMYYADKLLVKDENNNWEELKEVNAKIISNYQFLFLKSLETVYYGKDTLITGTNAFNSCYNIKNVYFKGTIEDYLNLNFDSQEQNPIGMSSNVKFYLFDENTNEYYLLDKLIIPNNITEIKPYLLTPSMVENIVIPADSILEKITIYSNNMDSKINIYIYSLETYMNIQFESWMLKNLYLYNDETKDFELITHLVIPESVNVIKSGTFSYCFKINSVTLHENVELIEDNAFSSCDNLYEIINKSSINLVLGDWNNGSIAYNADVIHTEGESTLEYIDNFIIITTNNEKVLSKYTGNDTVVIVPEGITRLGKNAFSPLLNNMMMTEIEYSKITKIVLPESLEIIGDNSFNSCHKLNSITLPKNLKQIGSYPFSGCYLYEIINESSLNIPIDKMTYGLSYLEYVHTNESDSKIYEEDGFVYFKNKNNQIILISYIGNETEIVIPGKVYKIGNYAFLNSNITSVTISQGVEEVEYNAFEKCNELKQFILPKSLRTFNYYGGPKLEYIFFSGTNSEFRINYFNNYDKLYYYSSVKPPYFGNYWHYNDLNEIEIWK